MQARPHRPRCAHPTRRRRALPILGAAALVALVAMAGRPGEVRAAVPDTMGAQGVLRSSTGALVEGPLNLTFTLYDAPEDGTALWTQEHQDVSVDGGLFSVELGPFSGAEQLFGAHPMLWLETAVTGEAPLPRQPVLSVAYAFRAQDADRADDVACTACIHTIHLADNSVSAAKVAFSFAGSDSAGGAATTAKALSCSGCVNGTHVADGSIGSAKVSFAYAAGVTPGGDALAAQALQCTGCVTTSHLAGGAVTSAKLAGNAVGTAHLQDGSVTAAKILSVGAGQVSPGEFSAGEFTFKGNVAIVGGGVKLGNISATCTAGLAGALRWTGAALQFCDGATWLTLGGASPETVPSPPSQVAGTPGSGQISVSFTAPTDDGGAPITSYTATCVSSSGGVTGAKSGSGSPLVVGSLTAGATYKCSVVATNSVGSSTASGPSAAVLVPPTVPGPPTGVVATVGSGVLTVTFTAPASNGGAAISSYTATCTSTTGGATGTKTGASSPLVVGGLTGNATYVCTVVATNSAGNSAPSALSAPVQIIVVPGSSTFQFTGSAQTFQVPSGVSSVVIEAWGAEGATQQSNAGLGGRAKARVPVTGGETLKVYVGGKGTAPTGGWNGGGNGYYQSSSVIGGGGGGASDVRRGGTTLNHRVVVAGGGGGTGNAGCGFCKGGGGGGTKGVDGVLWSGTPATGGTQTSGGVAGSYNCSIHATSGTFGKGGDGGYCQSSRVGPGGGGGWYGGAGTERNSGGSGGSGYVAAAGNTEGVMESAVRSGNGLVTITW